MLSEHLLEALRLAAEALAGVGAKFALIGGAAMPAWRHDRSTRDVDIVVVVEAGREAALAERIAHAVRERGFAHHAGADRRRLEEGLLLHAWYPLRPQAISLRLDLFLATDAHRAETIRRARPRRMDGFEVPVSTCEDLILLKCRAARPIDLADARALSELNAERLDRGYLERWADLLGLAERPWRPASTIPAGPPPA
ncbi:MAG: nucleotidyl transferase AbiEii/AbiGii toxin family protein [Planctomycetes bacterium]|nr:nucleotidyl transferase AbiEii/AbiGii toxin family protein [Planctomycetota bacterium]